MTPEAITKFGKALAALFVAVGGLGCIACLPLVFGSLPVAAATALFLIAGGVLMSGGLISFSLLNAQK
ncbi:MAG: hypothetical protein WCI27_03530 [Candidatus Omnitrophota bacterium]